MNFMVGVSHLSLTLHALEAGGEVEEEEAMTEIVERERG